MSSTGGPNISSQDLILYLDAANPKCFQSGWTTCNNLITNGLVTGANGSPGAGTHTPNPSNFPTYNSANGGVFDFAGGKGMNCEENLGFRTETTLIMWFYKNSGNTQYFSDARNNGGQWFLSNYTSDNINYTEQMTYNYDGVYNASNSNFLNKWTHMVVTSTGSGSKLYLNGELISTGIRNSIDEDFGVNFRIGTRYTTSAPWTGYMGPILAYGREISQDEVLEHYNGTKYRFI